MGLNSKEANNVELAEQVMELLPLYVFKENVVAIGEIGYDDQTEAEDRFFREQITLAKEVNLPIMVHTPHRDKKQGTSRSMDVLEEMGADPSWVVIDHNNEETCKEVLDRGYWAAFTIYPHTKMGNERMVEVAKKYGSERIIVDSSADWGVSDPLSVPKTANLMLERGIAEEDVKKMCYSNALEIYGKSGRMKESDWAIYNIDQADLNEDNSVLRGQTPQKTTSDNTAVN